MTIWASPKKRKNIHLGELTYARYGVAGDHSSFHNRERTNGDRQDLPFGSAQALRQDLLDFAGEARAPVQNSSQSDVGP